MLIIIIIVKFLKTNDIFQGPMIFASFNTTFLPL